MTPAGASARMCGFQPAEESPYNGHTSALDKESAETHSDTRDEPARVRRTSVTDRDTPCHAFTQFVAWVPLGDLPPGSWIRQSDVAKVQGVADSGLMEVQETHLSSNTKVNYERWAAAQPSLVDRPVYPTPTGIL
ncbi:hypothetical protein PI125_g7316 [Phytophthora idaei]|nr:hypothetical protein PI125_g7316 [Phytophthora idaei]